MRDDEVDRQKVEDTDAKMNEHLAKKIEDEDKAQKEIETKQETNGQQMTDDVKIDGEQG